MGKSAERLNVLNENLRKGDNYEQRPKNYFSRTFSSYPTNYPDVGDCVNSGPGIKWDFSTRIGIIGVVHKQRQMTHVPSGHKELFGRFEYVPPVAFNIIQIIITLTHMPARAISTAGSIIIVL